MDPVSHILLGRSLNGLDSEKRLGRGAGAAFILGSLAPDIDGALVTRGWDVYMHYHASGTHTFVAAPLLAAATAALVRVLVRDSRYSRLFLAALVGIVAGHLLFDLVSGSDMALAAPFTFRVFGPHLLTMADVSAIVVLLVGTAVSIRARTIGAAIVIAGLCALLAVKAVSMAVAASVYRSAATDAADTARPEAISGSLTRWRFYDRSASAVRAWSVDAWRREASVMFTRALVDDTIIERTKMLPAVRRFFGFAELPFARIETTGGGRRVLWSDVKYCEADRCDMSFGADVDAAGTPLREVIQLGGYVRTREIPR